MALIFEWDTNKARTNSIKHGVTFEEASTLFADEDSITIDDPSHSLLRKEVLRLGFLQRKEYWLWCTLKGEVEYALLVHAWHRKRRKNNTEFRIF
jgi:uncharacterized protein